MIYRLLNKYFRNEPYYADLIDLFHETTYQTELGNWQRYLLFFFGINCIITGQLLDLTQPPRGDFSAFTLENYKKIVKYKTAFYSFYLPVALSMLMAGISYNCPPFF